MRNLTEDRGFSLIETLVACALLATALLSIGHLSTAAIVLLMDSRGRTEATLLAVSKLDELRSSAAPADGADTVDTGGNQRESARLVCSTADGPLPPSLPTRAFSRSSWRRFRAGQAAKSASQGAGW